MIKLNIYAANRVYLGTWPSSNIPGLLVWNNGLDPNRYFILNPGSMKGPDPASVDYEEVDSYLEIGRLR